MARGKTFVQYFLSFCLVGAFLAIVGPGASAQTSGAVIHGIVMDASSAPIPDAEVAVVSAATGVRVATKTNAAGVYEFPALNPGTYTVTVTASGFAQYTRKEIDLAMLQRLRVDVQLQLSSVQQTIEVQGNPTVVDTESAKVTHTIEGEVVTNLPFRGRNVYMLTRLVPGGNNTAAADLFANSFDTFAPSNISFNGAPVQTNSITVNGVTNQFGNGALGFAPSMDAVEEVTVQSFALSAEYGQTSGSVVQLETKAGTKDLHGSLYHFYNGSALNANDFFGNKFGRTKTRQIINQFGGTVGGPVYIPRIYDGRQNKTFAFFNYEGIRELFGYRQTTTMPDERMRAGDFSHLRGANGQPINIYNPFTTRFDPNNPSVLIRDQFAGNRIPEAMISPISRNVMKYMPLPNIPGQVNNHLFSSGYTENSDSYQARADQHVSRNNIFNFSFGSIKRGEWFLSALPTGVTGWLYTTDSKIWTLGDNHVFNPTTILNVRLGVSWTQQSIVPHLGPEERNALGFPQSFLSLLRGQGFTSFGFPDGDISGFGQGFSAYSFYRPNLRAGLTKVAARHSITSGYEFAVYRANIRTTGGEDGNFSFSRELTRGPMAAVSSPNAGHGFATFLLGTPTGGSASINANSAAQNLYHALYIQDNWRVNNRLTLNLGFRWDYETPVTERYDRMSRGFDTTTPNPIAQRAEANYAAAPIPERTDFKVLGGLRFVNAGGEPRYNMHRRRDNFMPRAGFAFQLRPATVIRGGYGLFYMPMMEIRGYGVSQSNLPLRQDGFSATTSMDAIREGRPFNTLTNPFPDGLIQPVGSALGLATLLGQNINAYDVNGRRGFSHQFQAGIQHELPWKIRLEVAYVGSRTDDLPVDAPINALPERFLALGDELNRQVPNPFFGLIQTGTLSRNTVAKRQLLLPFPQFGSTNLQFQPIGSMWYNSLQVNANKRLSRGVSFLASYTWGRHMERRSFLNAYHPLERVISQIDRPHRLVLSGEWEIPVGTSRTYGRSLPRALQYVIGNWDVTWVSTFTSGQPITGFGGAMSVKEPADIKPTIDKWFDTSAFAPLPPNTVRTLSSNLDWLRFDGTNNVDITIGKEIPIRETVHFRLQGQFYNAFNTPQFSMPNTSVTSAAFGTVTGQANQPRWVQISGKFIF